MFCFEAALSAFDWSLVVQLGQLQLAARGEGKAVEGKFADGAAGEADQFAAARTQKQQAAALTVKKRRLRGATGNTVSSTHALLLRLPLVFTYAHLAVLQCDT